MAPKTDAGKHMRMIGDGPDSVAGGTEVPFHDHGAPSLGLGNHYRGLPIPSSPGLPGPQLEAASRHVVLTCVRSYDLR